MGLLAYILTLPGHDDACGHQPRGTPILSLPLPVLLLISFSSFLPPLYPSPYLSLLPSFLSYSFYLFLPLPFSLPLLCPPFFLCLSVRLSVCLSVCMSVCLSLSLLSVSFSLVSPFSLPSSSSSSSYVCLCLSVCMSVCPPSLCVSPFSLSPFSLSLPSSSSFFYVCLSVCLFLLFYLIFHFWTDLGTICPSNKSMEQFLTIPSSIYLQTNSKKQIFYFFLFFLFFTPFFLFLTHFRTIRPSHNSMEQFLTIPSSIYLQTNSKKQIFFIFFYFFIFTPFFSFFEPFSDHPSFSHIHGSILDHPVLHIFTNEVKNKLYEQFLPMAPLGVIRLLLTPGGVIHVCDMSCAKANVRFVVCDMSCFPLL